MSNIRDARQALIARILEGEGQAAKQERRAAFDNAGLTDPMKTLARKVAESAHFVSDGDVAAVRTAGASEDQVFELVVCAAVGEAQRQLDAALAALDAASREN